MTTYHYNLGAGGTRTLVLDGNTATLDGETVSLQEALDFMQNANAEGIKPEITKDPVKAEREARLLAGELAERVDALLGQAQEILGAHLGPIGDDCPGGPAMLDATNHLALAAVALREAAR